MMIQIAIADDHPLIRQGLSHVIKKTEDIFISGEFDNTIDLLNHLKENCCDVVLLDINMPGPDNLEVIQRIHGFCPECRILMISMHTETAYVLRTLKAGAAGFFSKNTDVKKLIPAIRMTHQGRRYLSPEVAEKLANALCDDDRDTQPHQRLSDREYQVLVLLGSGKTVSEIADMLGLSVKTISTYRARILEKMGMENNAQLTFYTIQNRLI